MSRTMASLISISITTILLLTLTTTLNSQKVNTKVPSIELTEAPDGHQYVIFRSAYGVSMVHAAGCKTCKKNAEQEIAQHPPATPSRTAYEEFLQRYESQARVVRRGDPLMFNDDKPLLIRGQKVLYDGLDGKNIVVKYTNESKSGERIVRNPIISINKVARPEGTPSNVIAGDVQLQSQTIRILSATDEECRYILTE